MSNKKIDMIYSEIECLCLGAGLSNQMAEAVELYGQTEVLAVFETIKKVDDTVRRINELFLMKFVEYARELDNNEGGFYSRYFGGEILQFLENAEEYNISNETISRIFGIRPKKCSEVKSLVADIVLGSKEPLAKLIRNAILDTLE